MQINSGGLRDNPLIHVPQCPYVETGTTLSLQIESQDVCVRNIGFRRAQNRSFQWGFNAPLVMQSSQADHRLSVKKLTLGIDSRNFGL